MKNVISNLFHLCFFYNMWIWEVFLCLWATIFFLLYKLFSYTFCLLFLAYCWSVPLLIYRNYSYSKKSWLIIWEKIPTQSHKPKWIPYSVREYIPLVVLCSCWGGVRVCVWLKRWQRREYSLGSTAGKGWQEGHGSGGWALRKCFWLWGLGKG